MKPLKIEATDETPGIILDKENNIFEMSGRSLPEDAAEFFRPVLQWIEHYKKEPNIATQLVFKLDYANTASSKMIQDILSTLERIKGVTIVWCYREDDEDIFDMGQEFSELVEIPFAFKNF